jgi:hypothetical protein
MLQMSLIFASQMPSLGLVPQVPSARVVSQTHALAMLRAQTLALAMLQAQMHAFSNVAGADTCL